MLRWVPKLGVKNLTQEVAEKFQSTNFNHATQDLYDAIERGDFPDRCALPRLPAVGARELVTNMIANLKVCKKDIEERMVHNLAQADAEYGRRVAEGIGMKAPKLAGAPGDDSIASTGQRKGRMAHRRSAPLDY